jgi:hypothetical protein
MNTVTRNVNFHCTTTNMSPSVGEIGMKQGETAEGPCGEKIGKYLDANGYLCKTRFGSLSRV